MDVRQRGHFDSGGGGTGVDPEPLRRRHRAGRPDRKARTQATANQHQGCNKRPRFDGFPFYKYSLFNSFLGLILCFTVQF